jgi:hypothetical protein
MGAHGIATTRRITAAIGRAFVRLLGAAAQLASGAFCNDPMTKEGHTMNTMTIGGRRARLAGRLSIYETGPDRVGSSRRTCR